VGSYPRPPSRGRKVAVPSSATGEKTQRQRNRELHHHFPKSSRSSWRPLVALLSSKHDTVSSMAGGMPDTTSNASPRAPSETLKAGRAGASRPRPPGLPSTRWASPSRPAVVESAVSSQTAPRSDFRVEDSRRPSSPPASCLSADETAAPPGVVAPLGEEARRQSQHGPLEEESRRAAPPLGPSEAKGGAAHLTATPPPFLFAPPSKSVRLVALPSRLEL